MIRQYFRFIIFSVGILTFCMPFFLNAETTEENDFIRVSEDLNIRLVDQPAYFYSDNRSEIPSGESFIKLENTQTNWHPVSNSEPHWIRIIVENTGQTNSKVILKSGIFPSKLYVYYKGDSNDWVTKGFGILVPEDASLDSYYPASEVVIRRGIDTLYVYNADTWSKFDLRFIRFTDRESLKFDRSDFLMSHNYFSFYLFSFNILLIFQIVYVILQAYYHRKREYLEYILFLLSVSIYFLIRFEIHFDSSIITHGAPQLRRLLNDLMLLLPFAFYLRFARYFIGMPEKYPVMNSRIKVAENIVFVLAAIFILFSLTGLRKYDSIFLQVVTISCSLYSLYLIIFFYRQRNKQISFILIGSLAALIGHILGMASSWIEIHNLLFKIQPIIFTMTGIMIEIFFFNTGLGYKAKYEQQEKLFAQEKLINQLNSNHKMQDRLQNMRNRIASDLHDDVGSTLSSIGLYSEVGIEQIDKNTGHVKGILEKISSSSQRMMTAMNDIVWAIKSQNSPDEGLIKRIAHFAEDRLGPMNIKFSIHHDETVNSIILSMEAKRNILLIAKEAINNAAKYSQSPFIECNLFVKDDMLLMEIRDYGNGFENTGKKFGNGIGSMEERASQMKGKLEVHSQPGKGTTVKVSIAIDEIDLGNRFTEH